jgi:hypothetical protein
MDGEAPATWLTEAQQSLLRFRVLCSLLLHLRGREAVVFGGTALCVLDRARGGERFRDAMGKQQCALYERSFGTRAVHPASAHDRLKLPGDVDIALPSSEGKSALVASLGARRTAPRLGERLPLIPFAHNRKQQVAPNYLHNPLFASFYVRHSYAAMAEEPHASVYAARGAEAELRAHRALSLDVVVPSCDDAPYYDVVAVSVYPNWLKHLGIVVDERRLPRGKRPVRGKATIFPAHLEATFLLPSYVEERLEQEGGVAWPTVAHLQRLAEARVTCSSLAFGGPLRRGLERLADRPLAVQTARRWREADTLCTLLRFFDVAMKELRDAWVSPLECNLRPGGWRLRDEQLLQYVLTRLENGMPLNDKLVDWCASRRDGAAAGEVTVLRLLGRERGYSSLQFCSFDTKELRRSYRDAVATLPTLGNMPLYPPGSLVLRLAPTRTSRYVFDGELPVLKLLSNDDVRAADSDEFPLKLTGGDDGWIARALTVPLRGGERASFERALWSDGYEPKDDADAPCNIDVADPMDDAYGDEPECEASLNACGDGAPASDEVAASGLAREECDVAREEGGVAREEGGVAREEGYVDVAPEEGCVVREEGYVDVAPGEGDVALETYYVDVALSRTGNSAPHPAPYECW